VTARTKAAADPKVITARAARAVRAAPPRTLGMIILIPLPHKTDSNL
jgi:hypothetical protein